MAYKRPKPTGLAGRIQFQPIEDADNEFFFSVFTEEVKTSVAPHINIPSKVFGEDGEQSVLIIRESYDAILPYIQARWGAGLTIVTGTPGVGKTYLGVWHLRLLVQSGEPKFGAAASEDSKIGSVFVYFRGGRLYVFTWDEQKKAELSLPSVTVNFEENGRSRSLWSGCVSTSLEYAVRSAQTLLAYRYCYVIADPQDQDSTIVNKLPAAANLAIYASHGHPVISFLKTKKPILGGNNMFVLPGWSADEFKAHVPLLQIYGAAIPQAEIPDRLFVGGKMLRFLLATRLESVKSTLKSKIIDVVKAKAWNQMENIISPDFKGSLVSLDLPTYQYAANGSTPNLSKAGQNFNGEPENMQVGEQACTVSNPFSFDKAECLHVSDFVIEELERELKSFTCDEIGMMAEQWSTNGYMSVFGALFERHSHLALEAGERMPLYAVLPPVGKSQTTSQKIGELNISASKEVKLVEGNDPAVLENLDLQNGTHIRPVNSNFPTYDLYIVSSGASALVFDDQVMEIGSIKPESSAYRKRAASGDYRDAPWKKVKLDDLVAFGMQCTVSGASGVPPRPKHKVWHKIVTQSTSAMKAAQPKIMDFLTVFVVPPICVEGFVYQMPQTSKNKDVMPNNMPEVQYVAALSTKLSQGFEKMVLKKKEEEEETKRRAALITSTVARGRSLDDTSLGRAGMKTTAGRDVIHSL